MKFTSSRHLLLTTVALSSFLHQTYSICIDFYDPMNLSNSSTVDCSPKQINDISNIDNLQLDDSNLFQVNFICDTEDPDLCEKAKRTFNKAGDIVTYALTLHAPIIADVTFTDMDLIRLGGASPTRYISLLDEDDQVERLYPQALVKQLNLPTPPAEYASSDITAQFNSLINWYVPDDDGPIKKDQFDLLNTVLHEFIHGLGFVSSWRNYVDDDLGTPTRGLTPFIVTEFSDSSYSPDIPKTRFKFLGFGETIFDKFIITKNNGKQARLSEFANELNQFGINQQFDPSDFEVKLQNSPQYGAAEQVLSLSTTKNSLIFMPKGAQSIPDDGIVLETGISPYQAGSSITHVDATIYNGDSDFLMRRLNSRGVSMNDLIIKSGNRTGSAIGPKLLNILSSIGYDLADNPIKPSFVKSSASIFNKQSIVIDFIFTALCIIINHTF